jgi:carboxyl-terminal processing protease
MKNQPYRLSLKTAATAALLLWAAAAERTTPTFAAADADTKPAAATADYVTTTAIQTEAKVTILCLEKVHLLKKPFSSLNAAGILKDYVANLDTWHLFFLADDIEFYKKQYGATFDLYAANGNLTPAFTIYKDFLARIDKRIDWLNHRLDSPLTLDTDATFISDRSKLAWPTTEAEANTLWENRLKLELILELLSDAKTGKTTAKPDKKEKTAAAKTPTPTLANIPPERLAEAVAAIRKRYNKVKTYLRFEPHEVEEIFLNTIAAQYDPHTSFFSKQSLTEFEIAMRNKLIGIGAVLRDEDGYCVIKEVIPGGPLDSTKRIKVGDRIVAVGQGTEGDFTDVVGMRLNKIISQLRGKEDTTVRLRISPATDRASQYTLTLNRAEIKLTKKLAKAAIYDVPASDGSGKTIPIGVIDLPAFYGKDSESGDTASTTEDVAELVRKLKKRNIRGLVLDLRRNGGGYLEEAVNLTGLFIPARQPVVQVHGSFGDVEKRVTPRAFPPFSGDNILWDGPLIVLVSKLSASASEIVAGALKDHRRALIVGDEHTHGKGSVQQLIPVDRLTGGRGGPLGSAVKVTIQKWYLPSGNSIQLKGVGADIPVPSTYSVLPVAESDLERPLAWDTVPTSFTAATAGKDLRVAINDGLLKTLRDSSLQRQTRLPEFSPLNKTIKWMKSREKTRAFPINYTAMKTERDQDKAFRDAIRDTYKSLETSKFKTEDIKLDAALEQEKKEAATKAAEAAEKKKAPAVPKPPIAPVAPVAPTDSDDTDAAEDDDISADSAPEFDVQRRESLRILADWFRQLPPKKLADKK